MPAVAFAQAEPAPESYRPPRQPGMPQPHEAQQREADSKLPKWHIAVAPHLNFLFGDTGLPLIGYGGGVQVTRALLPLGRGRFGLGADFAYDRFSHDLKTTAFSSSSQFVAHATFAAMLVVDGIAGRVRPWIALGGGFSVANYESPMSPADPKGTSIVGVAGLLKLALGFGVRIYEGFELGLRGDFDLTFSDQQAMGKSVWSPGLFSLGLDLGFRF
jgi:hypothetical protein